MSNKRIYDVVVVGTGVVGTTFAKVLAESAYRDRKAISILILEAGPDLGLDRESYQSYVNRFYTAEIKTPNSPYPYLDNAPAPEDIAAFKPRGARYFRQNGPLEFGSNNTRALGGTTLHWMGIALRMLPSDFKMKSTFDVGVDWPISYEDLRPFYEKAEWELGVSASVDDQLCIHGMRPTDFGKGYEYPMLRIPKSYLDTQIENRLGDEFKFRLGREDLPIRLVPLPQARNSVPTPGALDCRDYLDSSRRSGVYQPFGAPYDPITGPGQRCEGNASCIPICPVHAKYSALKTIQQLLELNKLPGIDIDIQTQSVVTSVNSDTSSGAITNIEYKRYISNAAPAASSERVVAQHYALAASGIENAKIMLASRTKNRAIGRYLMDHPFVLNWARMPKSVKPFRGPGATVDMPMRDGAFRSRHASFRCDVGNWGWGLTQGAPESTLEELITGNNPVKGKKLQDALVRETKGQITFGFLMEQLPNASNKVTIDESWVDQMGIYKPVIDYDIDRYTLD